MKRLLLTLILIFNFQSFAKADDISDFQIEGMSIGDSLLDYFSEEQIKKNIRQNSYEGSDHKFYDIEIYDSSLLKTYDGLQISLKKNDNQYIVHSIGGGIFFESNEIEKCYSKQDEIDKDLILMFKKTQRNYRSKIPHPGYANSTLTSITYVFKSGDNIELTCFDWDNEIDAEDYLLLSIDGVEFTDWLIDYYNNI